MAPFTTIIVCFIFVTKDLFIEDIVLENDTVYLVIPCTFQFHENESRFCWAGDVALIAKQLPILSIECLECSVKYSH